MQRGQRPGGWSQLGFPLAVWLEHITHPLWVTLLVFSPSSRFMARSNVMGRLLHKVELLVCFNIYLDQTFVKSALRTNKIGICYSIAT